MRWKLLAAGLGMYGVCLGITAPATLLDAALQHASGGRVRIAEARGTLWSGNGQVELRDAAERQGVAKSIAWHVVPEASAGGRLACDIAVDHSPKPMRLTFSLSGLKLDEADIDLPAAALGLAIAKLAPLELKGDLQLHVTRLSAGRQGVSGGATLHWLGAGSAHSPVAPLGDYELRLDSGEKTTLATLRTLKGPLSIVGQGSWTSGDEPVFQAALSVPPAYRAQLAPLLGLLAFDRGDGNFELSVK